METRRALAYPPAVLERLRALREEIGVAIVGVGSAGEGLLHQCERTPGMRCVAIADIDLARAVACAESVAREHRVVTTLGDLHDAIHRGALAVCEDGEMLARCERTRVLIEASSSVPAGGAHALAALEHGLDVVMMNAEADLEFGPYLMRVARANGAVYTSCDGDQPAVISRLVSDLRLWGFELVMAGNVKGFLDRHANPTTIAPEADKRYLDHKMCASYTDGTKLAVEMALVANAFGCDPVLTGMRGPRAGHVRDVLRLFDLETLWQQRQPLVDYVLGAEPKGGVFAVGHCDDPYQRRMLSWLPPEMGDGPFYVFYRPYHLVHVEAMACVAEAVLDRRALLQPWAGPRTDVYARAKRDLREGEVLDGIGGYACYGLLERCADNRDRPGVPICLSEGMRLRREVRKDEKILLSDVTFDADSAAHRLYRAAQDAAGWGAS
jgi:predicted homoserine dehydrogenase-like protein